MHRTALNHGRLFFESYRPEGPILEIGSQDVNGSLRSVAPECPYTGADFVAGKGVDVVISDPYMLPFDEDSFDAVVSSSCFEHSEFFWLIFLEALRVLKPAGLFYLNVPTNGQFHQYPVDCWRFYPDSGRALQNWARRNGIDALLLESFTGPQKWGVWNDFVAVFVKNGAYAHLHPRRMIYREATNGYLAGNHEVLNPFAWSEDQRTICAKLKRFVARD